MKVKSWVVLVTTENRGTYLEERVMLCVMCCICITKVLKKYMDFNIYSQGKQDEDEGSYKSDNKQ